jgi:hypothetical protein
MAALVQQTPTKKCPFPFQINFVSSRILSPPSSIWHDLKNQVGAAQEVLKIDKVESIHIHRIDVVIKVQICRDGDYQKAIEEHHY